MIPSLASAKQAVRSVVEPLCVSALVVIGHLSLIGRFGASWDEPLHRSWGQLFLLYWHTGDLRFVEEMPGYGAFYGPLFHVLNFRISEFLYKTWHVPFVAANHVLIILTFCLCCGLLFAVARAMFSRRIAWISVLLFVLLPQLMAHAQYNPKDIPLMTTCTLTLLAGYTFFKRRTPVSAIVAGVCFGAALAIKLSAIMILPALLLAYLSTLWTSADRRTSASLIKDLWMTGLIFVSAFISLYAFWPSLWSDISLLPRGFDTFIHAYWPGQVLYFGTEYGGEQLPWHYIPLSLLITLPIPTMAFFFAGICAGIRRIRRRDHVLEYVLLLCWILFPLLLSMKPGIVRYDGYRQFYFTLPVLAIVAAVGLEACADALRKRFSSVRSHVWLPAIAGVTAVWILVEIAIVFPYTGSYFNQLLRWPLGPNLERQVEVEFWGPTYKEGMQWLIDNAEPDPEICVPISGQLVTWYPWRDDFTFNCTPESDYVMYFSRYTFNKQYSFNDREPIFEIRRYDSRLLSIFKIK
jgi:Dolichyl-phosphate-mannose-protein mannosyltransferase